MGFPGLCYAQAQIRCSSLNTYVRTQQLLDRSNLRPPRAEAPPEHFKHTVCAWVFTVYEQIKVQLAIMPQARVRARALEHVGEDGLGQSLNRLASN